MQNLRDKLLKAGKVSRKDKRQADQQARRQRKKKKGHVQNQEAEAERQAIYEARLAEQRARDAELAEQERQRRLAHERKLRVWHIIDYYSLHLPRGRRRWYFAAQDNIVHHLDVKEQDAYRLQTGQLAIVQRPDTNEEQAFRVVPRETANTLWEINDTFVRFLNRKDNSKPLRWFEAGPYEDTDAAA